MVYTDKIHLAADTLDELHLFAKQIGVYRDRYHSKARHKHYHLSCSQNRKALKNGAIAVTTKQLILILTKHKQ